MRQSTLLLSTIGVFAIACSDEQAALDEDFSGDPLAQLQPTPELISPPAPQADPNAAPTPTPEAPEGVTRAPGASGEVICEVSDPAFKGARTCLATCEVPCASASPAADISAHIDVAQKQKAAENQLPGSEMGGATPPADPNKLETPSGSTMERVTSTAINCDVLAPADRGMGAIGSPGSSDRC